MRMGWAEQESGNGVNLRVPQRVGLREVEWRIMRLGLLRRN